MCKKLVIFYKRVSTQAQVTDRDGLLRQQRAFDEWWSKLPDRGDYDLEEYADEGVSAFSGANVNGGNLGKINQRVFNGEIPRDSILVIHDSSRFSRRDRRETLSDLWRYHALGVSIFSLMENRFINGDDIGTDLITMLGADSNHSYSDRISKFVGAAKAKEQHQVRIERRGVFKGSVPHWLKRKAGDYPTQPEHFEVLPEQASIIQRIFEMRYKRMSMIAIAATLNGEGIPVITQRDFRRKAAQVGWTPSTIKNLLRHVAVIGTLSESSRKGSVYPAVPGYYPAIVDNALFEAVQLTLTKGKQTSLADGDESNPYAIRIFKSLLICKFCGQKMDVNGARGALSVRGTPFAGSLICRNARNLSCMHGKDGGRTPTVPMRIVENALTEGLFQQLNQTNIRNDITRQIAKKRQQLDTLKNTIDRGAEDLMKDGLPDIMRNAILERMTFAGKHYEELQTELLEMESKQRLQSVDNLGGLDLMTRDGRIAAYNTIVKTISKIVVDTVEQKCDVHLLNGNMITGFSFQPHPLYPEDAETYAKNQMSQLADDEFGLLTGLTGQSSVKLD